MAFPSREEYERLLYSLPETYEECLRWYDPQPLLTVAELKATFPHHLHEPPDIKHNRKPAPGISFIEPNLSVLIRNCM